MFSNPIDLFVMGFNYQHTTLFQHENITKVSRSHFVPFFQVFDAFKARLQESNSKVNLYALESLQKIIHSLKDNLSQVVNILVPAIVDNHLNSKNNAVYSAAIGAINALISNLGTRFEHSHISDGR